jgi:hypothetical protein
MAQGLLIYDANGVLKFNSGDYLPRYLGSFQTGGYNGSISNGNLVDGTGTPFVIFYPLVSGYSNGFPSGWNNPSFTFSGSTLSWAFDPSVSPGYGTNCMVLYGLR